MEQQHHEEQAKLSSQRNQMLGNMTARAPQQQEVVPEQFEEFMSHITNA